MKFKPFKNIWIKILALLVGCVLWLHVATEQEFEHTFKYPLLVEGLPNEYVLGAPLPDSVEVLLKGRGKDLIKLLFSDGEVAIDASGFKYSERYIEPSHLNLRIPEIDYEFLGYVKKDHIRLVIDRYTDKPVPVKSGLVLEPASGYAALEAKIQFDPPRVVVGGPENLVRTVENVYTVPETLKGLNKSTTHTVSINQESNLISYTPTSLSAYIEVEPLRQVTFEDIVVTVKSGKLRSNERLIPETISITFTGTEEQIEALKREKIQVFVDYVDVRTQGGQIRPIVVHPPSVNVVSLNPEYFTIQEK